MDGSAGCERSQSIASGAGSVFGELFATLFHHRCGLMRVWGTDRPAVEVDPQTIPAIRENARTLLVGELWKSYRKLPALRGVDLEVSSGGSAFLLGRNGAGKSTLLSAIAGLTNIDSGAIEVAGVSVTHCGRLTRKMLGLPLKRLASTRE